MIGSDVSAAEPPVHADARNVEPGRALDHDADSVPHRIPGLAGASSPMSSAPSALAPPSGGAETPWQLDQIVNGLRHSREVTHNVRHQGKVREIPSRAAIGETLHQLCAVLFPTHYGRPDLTDADIDYFVGSTLSNATRVLTDQIRRGLLFDAETSPSVIDTRVRADQITRSFVESLIPIRALLVSDLRAAFHGDPAASSISEVLLCYPGTIAIIYHRMAHALWQEGARFVARLISDISHSMTGIDIHPGAQIGGRFFIDHGTGVVIGETAIIGEGVRLYQHVTLGAKRFPADEDGNLIKGNARHPIVEDDVVIYAGATILGRITIGSGSTIGGNVWLTHSVPANSSIAQARMRND